MKITFIANACCIYESEGKRLITDPWLVPGAFGSWTHIHPLRTKPEDVANCDYMYISHLHPDHFCKKTLKAFRRDIPIVILDPTSGPNYLLKLLKAEGFNQIIEIKQGTTAGLGPFTIRFFDPFTKHPFHDSEIGNLVDSAILIEDEVRHKIFNFNDNTPSVESAKRLNIEYGPFDAVQLNYNNAGPYPACFKMSDEEKIKECDRLITRNLDHMVAVTKALKAKYVIPFAGEYKLMPPLEHLNPFLGTVNSGIAAGYLSARQDISTAVWMREGDVLSLAGPAIERTKYLPMGRARENLIKKQVQLGIFPECWIEIITEESSYGFPMNKLGDPRPENTLKCTLTTKLMNKILNREEHWNNAEIGCHIEFERVPNVYMPDVHTLMSFFHL